MQQEIDTYISEGEAIFNVLLLVSLSLVSIPIVSFYVHIVKLYIFYYMPLANIIVLYWLSSFFL